MTQFSSNAEEIRFYAKKLLQDGLMHTRDEIFQYVKENSPNGHIFTTGMYTGALRDLVRNSNGAYMIPVRGHYQQASREPGELAGLEMRNKIIDVLDAAYEGLKQACTVNIIGLSAEELSVASKVEQIMNALKEAMEEIKEM